MSSPLRCESLRDGAVERMVLATPKANVLDAVMIGAIRAQLERLRGRVGLKLIVFEGEGRHFSFGASVAEHLPAQVAEMLAGFHAMFREFEDVGVPSVALVRGQCLGGGAELACWCGKVIADPSARIGLPEITLGVFPPIGALILPRRVGLARATELVITGVSVAGEAAATMGLVDLCVEDPEAALWAWYDAHLADKSAVGLRCANQAARLGLRHALVSELPDLEQRYLNDLMGHADPVEGLNAFLERRPPTWSHQ